MDGTLQREVKKVRKARNRRQEWNMMALDKELRPDHRHTIHRDRGASSEGSMSPENRYDHRLIFLIVLITGSCLHHFCISFFSSSSSSSPLSLSGDTVLISSTTPTP